MTSNHTSIVQVVISAILKLQLLLQVAILNYKENILSPGGLGMYVVGPSHFIIEFFLLEYIYIYIYYFWFQYFSLNMYASNECQTSSSLNILLT